VHIYAFGSVCRGEIDAESDIDILAVVDENDNRFDTAIYSIYSSNRLSELWKKGNPFAWHLASEAKIIYSSDGKDFIKNLGIPSEYRKCKEDCRKFFTLYCKAIASISSGGNSLVFEMSTIFLAIRNFATCFLLGQDKIGNFSRQAALQMGEKSVQISNKTYRLLERSRILCIRGTGEMIQRKEIESSLDEIISIKKWMESLLNEVETNGRI
jgi:predicted nucleotidyltransferase